MNLLKRLFCANKNQRKDFEAQRIMSKCVKCGKEYVNKSFIGIYLGELPISITTTYNQETKKGGYVSENFYQCS